MSDFLTSCRVLGIDISLRLLYNKSAKKAIRFLKYCKGRVFFMKLYSYEQVDMTGGFAHEKQELNRLVTIKAVYDRFTETGRFDAFRFAYREGDPIRPHYFWDSDVAKWAEGVAYILKKHPTPELERIVDEVVEQIEKNQQIKVTLSAIDNLTEYNVIVKHGNQEVSNTEFNAADGAEATAFAYYGKHQVTVSAKDANGNLYESTKDVALSTDEFNWNSKQKKCYFTFEERKRMVEALRCVDLVIPEESWSQKETDVKEFRVDTFVMGDDWKGKFDFLKENCEVIYLPRTPEISSTQIKADLKEKKHG
jgi:glycerol-3-phosphate cytidylyltransferase